MTPQTQPTTPILKAEDIRFVKGEDDEVRLIHDGQETPIATFTAAFPLTHPNLMVALRDSNGNEIAILADTTNLDKDSRQIVREGMERSYFMPRIKDIIGIKENLNVLSWEVITDKGTRQFEIRHIRKGFQRIGPRRFVIRDVDGNRFEIRDWMRLPPKAQRLIEGYL